MQWDCRGGGEYLRNDKKRSGVLPSPSAGCLSDLSNGVLQTIDHHHDHHRHAPCMPHHHRRRRLPSDTFHEKLFACPFDDP